MEGFKTQIIALFLGFSVCASAQTFTGVADISGVTAGSGTTYTINVQSFNGGYLLGGASAYSALSIQANDFMWWNCDTFRVVSTSGGNPDGIAFTISVAASQTAPTPNSRVGFIRETEDDKQGLPFIGFNSPFGLSSDVWQCIQAYYAEHYRKTWISEVSEVQYGKVKFASDSVWSKIVRDDKTTRIWQDADSIALFKRKGASDSWLHVVTDSVTTQVNGNPFRVTGDSVSLGRKPANYLFNVGALLSAYSATPKSYVDSLVAAGGGGGAVSSVFGRTGAVTANNGDYTATKITNMPSGGIAATTVQAALNELDSEKLSAEVDGSTTNEIELPSQSGNSGKYLTTDGSTPSWATVSGGASYDVISPSQLTATTNDWNPTGLSTASLIRVTGNNGFRMITGITAPSSGKRLTITNVGSYSLMLTKEDGNSTAANRFDIDRDFTLCPSHSIDLFYDPTSARWKTYTVQNAAEGDGTYYEGMVKVGQSATTGDYSILTASASGTSAGTGVSAPFLSGSIIAPAYFNAYTGSTNTGAAGWFAKSLVARLDNTTGVNCAMSYRARVKFAYVSDATNTQTTRCGLANTNSVSTGDAPGVYFRYTHGENSGQWVGVTRSSGGTETVLNSSVAINTTDWYDLLICTRPDGTAAFFINNALVGVNAATNFPDNENVGYKIHITKSAGTTSHYLNWTGLFYSISHP